jgi:hypothetical protein
MSVQPAMTRGCSAASQSNASSSLSGRKYAIDQAPDIVSKIVCVQIDCAMVA